nr:hypothetical protein [Tanacetum cinerariifolium]
MDQNIDFSGSDQIQTPQYPEVHPPSPEQSNEYSNPENLNELFQKLLEDLKELAEYKESLENSSKEIAKQSMEDTMLELVKICHQKELLCIHDNVDDLIESALNTKLLSINSQHLDNEKQEVKNVVEQPAELTTILSTKEPKHSLSMGYEHLSITSETKSDEVTDFHYFSNPLFNDNDDLDSSDDESLPDEDVPAEEFKVYSNPLFDEDEINSDKLDPHCFNVESDFVESFLNRDTFIDSFSKFDFSGELAHVNPKIKESDFNFEEEIRLIENLLYDNSSPRPPEELNAEIADTIIDVENDDDSNDPLLEEADLFSDNSIPSGIKNVADDPEGGIHSLEELVIDDSILSHESSDFNFEDIPSVPRPPPEPPDVETDAGEKISVVMNDKDKFAKDYYFFMFAK